MPPNGFMGDSYGSPSMMSVASPTLSPLKSATNGCGAVVTHSSQCLYIRSVMTLPVAFGRSGYLSAVLGMVFTCATNKRCFSSGEKRKPSIFPSKCESCFFPVPSGFISHTWLLPLSVERYAIFVPFFIQTAWFSEKAEWVICLLSEPSAFITNSSRLLLSAGTL